MPAISPTGITDIWTGAINSDWNTPDNWSTNHVPSPGDAVIIPSGTANDAILSSATLTGETITLEQTDTGAPTVTFNDVVFDSLLSGTGTIALGGQFTIAPTGTV